MDIERGLRLPQTLARLVSIDVEQLLTLFNTAAVSFQGIPGSSDATTGNKGIHRDLRRYIIKPSYFADRWQPRTLGNGRACIATPATMFGKDMHDEGLIASWIMDVVYLLNAS
jgi:hypothetical protein